MKDNFTQNSIRTFVVSVLVLGLVGSGLVYVLIQKDVSDRYSADAAPNSNNLNKEIPGVCYSGEVTVNVAINDGNSVNGMNFGLRTSNPNLNYSSHESLLPGWVSATNMVSASDIRYISASRDSLSRGPKSVANISYTFSGMKEYPTEAMFSLIPGETYISNQEGSDLTSEGRYLTIQLQNNSENSIDKSPCSKQKLSEKSNDSLGKSKNREVEQNNLNENNVYAGEAGYVCYADSVRGDIAPAGSPDGDVNVGDVTSILRIAVGLDSPPSNLCCVDVAPRGETPGEDGDEMVNVGDVIRVLRASVGYENLGTCDNPSGAEEGILTLELSSQTPTNHIAVAGATSTKNAIFKAVATGEDFVITDLRIKVPPYSATSTNSIAIQYIDSSGVVQTQEKSLSFGTESYAQFQNLDLFVPADDQADFDVWVKTNEIRDGAETGAVIVSIFDYNSGFRAVGQSSSNVSNSVGDRDISSNQFSGRGEIHLRGTFPYITALTNSGNPATGIPIYRFRVTANPYDDVEIKKITFDVVTDGVDLSDFRLRNAVTGEDINTEVVPTVNADGQVEIWVGTQDDEEVEIIAAGNTIEYGLFAVVQGWSSGDILGVGINEEYTPLGPGSVDAISDASLIWSDGSAIPHSVNSSDWFNGYLVEEIPSATFW